MSGNLDVGMKCIKYMIFVTNFMFVMIGFLLISIGSTVRTLYTGFDLFIEEDFLRPSSLLIAIGIIILFVSVFGCIGAIRESVCLVNLYGLLLMIVLILEISAAITGYTMRADVGTYLEKNMNHTLLQYYEHDYAAESWDFLQYRFACCGIYDPNDWNNPLFDRLLFGQNRNFFAPDSCCQYKGCNNDTLSKRGCLDSLTNFVSECAVLIGTGAVCVAFVQLLGVIFAVMLGKAIRQLKTEQEMKRQELRQRLYAELILGNNEKPTPVLFAPTPTESEA